MYGTHSLLHKENMGTGAYELNCRDLECPCEPLTTGEYLKLTEAEKKEDFERTMCRVNKIKAIFKWRHLYG